MLQKEGVLKELPQPRTDDAESSENEYPTVTATDKSGVNDEGSSSTRRSKRKGCKSVKIKKKKGASPSDKEAKDAARTSKESAKKTAKMVIKKAKLAALSNVQKAKTEVNRGRKTDRQPQCYVCHQSFDNTKKLNQHRVLENVKELFLVQQSLSGSPKLKCDHCTVTLTL